MTAGDTPRGPVSRGALYFSSNSLILGKKGSGHRRCGPDAGEQHLWAGPGSLRSRDVCWHRRELWSQPTCSITAITPLSWNELEVASAHRTATSAQAHAPQLGWGIERTHASQESQVRI